MMKFREGDSVEALRREHDPWGTWFLGTIILINGDDYVIEYEYFMDQEGEPIFEKVYGEDVRPQPRHQPGKNWRVGDVAEVFDDHCWRVGKIAKVLQNNSFVIQLLGSNQLTEFYDSDLRIRLAWHNNKWSVIGKISSGLRLREVQMMKFREGDSVEALRRDHDPWGTWYPGTIISINGDDYVIEYDYFMGQEGEPVFEKVYGEDVRPQPHHQPGKNWRVGDVAEVFDDHCWRVGKVAKVLQNNSFVIRLLGSNQLTEFYDGDLRIRLAWHNYKWSVIGKVARDRQFTQKNYSKHSSVLFSGGPLREMGKDSHPRAKDKQECCEDEQDHKNLAIGGNHKKRKLSSCASLPLFKPVGNISSIVRENEKFTEEPTEMDAKKVKATSEQLHISSTRPHLYSNDCSSQCSVASCSSNDFADALGPNFREPLENASNDSDAESSFPSVTGKTHIFPFSRHERDVDIHELELHAYKSTVQALYASGPLSWGHESLLTNLRLSLNISDEEHLFQLRHLLSPQVM